MKCGVGLVFVVLASLGCAQQSLPRCTSMRVRPNAANLSPQQWSAIANVMRRMNNDGWMSRFGASHDRLFSRVHGNTCFFPFHRRYVLEFENIARGYDPNFVVPYWDATESFRTPATDKLLSATALGTNGESSDHCVTNGIQSNTQVTYPDNHCLRRNFNNGNSIAPWYAPEIISSYIQADTSLAQFREDIEYSIHGAVHLGLGGEMNTGYAAQDFSFMVHHANLDRLWWDWQNTHNSFLMYDGTGSSGPASLRDSIPEDAAVPFNGASVESVMVLGYGNVCYTYDSSVNPPQNYPGGGGNGGGSSNGAAVTSASPNASNRDRESQGILGSLSSDTIDRFFPGLSGGSRSRRRRGNDKPAPHTSNSGRYIPFPSQLTPEWIAMHGYDPTRVRAAHANACELVTILNNSTYASPY
ncbi:hypothetical protein H4R19_002035 [Coemansia spiralis]|nr:hypothetical protein H4R19_002035 [Coemansia spiralis]